MTRSMSTPAPACLAPLGTASSPPWASSRSPGTTASTQVGEEQDGHTDILGPGFIPLQLLVAGAGLHEHHGKSSKRLRA